MYLEDLAPGQQFSAGPVEVTAELIKRFALEYDPQPFHLDEQAADAHPIFGGLAASGWHTAALTMRMVVDAIGHFGWGVVGGGGELLWLKPVRPGDTLRMVSEVLEVQPSKSRTDRGSVVMRNTTLNQQGEPVQTFTVKLLVPRRPA